MVPPLNTVDVEIGNPLINTLVGVAAEPTYKLPAIPTPPATVNAPYTEPVDVAVFKIVKMFVIVNCGMF